MGKARQQQRGVPAPALTQSADLGELGEDRGTLDITFDWFGTQLRVNPGAGELELAEFLIEADGIDVGETDTDLERSLPAMKAVFKFLKAQIHPDDWPIFFDLAKTKRQTTMDLMRVAMRIVDKVSGFPTGPSDDSGPGIASTKPKSKGGSPSQASDRSSSLTRRALALVPATRPDLAHAYIQAEEARVGR